MVKKKKAVSQALSPQICSSPYFLFFFQRSPNTCLWLEKNEDSYFYCITSLTVWPNALNLTVTTVYLLAAVTFMFLEALMANQFAIQ